MLNCEQFEDLLPEVIDGGAWSAEQRAHAQSCKSCTSLVNDLRNIAQESKYLAESDEPGPRVWQELRKSLVAEGLIRKPAKHGRLMDFFFAPRWRPILVPVGAVAALAIVFLAYQSDRAPVNGPATSAKVGATAGDQSNVALLDDEDVQLLNQLSMDSPAVRASYEDSLKNVNLYIRDAKEVARKNPGNDAAQDALMQAYKEKTMVYEMAANRSAH
jgi:hypothetical protein